MRVFLFGVWALIWAGNSANAGQFLWNGVDGDWFTGENWTPNGQPGSGDTVIIRGGTLRLNTNATVTAFHHEDGTLTGSGTLTVTGDMTFMKGTMSGTGVTRIEATGSLNLTSVEGMHIIGRRIECFADTTMTGEGSVAGLVLSDGAVFNQRGLFDMQSDAGIAFTGTGTEFNNLGTLRKSGGSVIGFCNAPFNNTGLVDVRSGTLSIGGSGTSTGDWTVTNGATLRFAFFDRDLKPTSGKSISGGGDVEFFTGTTTLSGEGSYNITGTTRIVGGTAIFNLTNAATVGYFHNTGTIDGSGTLSISGPAVYERGDMRGSGVTRLEASGSLSLTSLEAMHLTGRRFDCFGNTTMTGNGAVVAFRIQDGGVFNQHGVFDMQSDAGITFSGSDCQFNNHGTFRKSGGTGIGYCDSPFSNSGTVEAKSGTLSIGGGGTNTGNWTIDAGATLRFAFFDRTVQLASGRSISGAGDVEFHTGITTLSGEGSYNITGTTRIVGGTAIFNLPTATTSGYAHNTGTFDGMGLFSITGAAVYERGDIRGSGTTRVESTGSLGLTGVETMHITGRRFDCFADTTWTGTGISLWIRDGAVFNNHGVFDVQADSFLTGSGQGAVFNNHGTFKKTGGAGEMRAFGVALTNAGSLFSESGTLRFNITFIQTAGSIQLSTGNLRWDFPLVLEGGTLTGAGTVVGDVINNGGTVQPGASLGNLLITGNYQQTVNGALAIELGGTTAGSQFDALQVSGTATLAGTVSVSAANGFLPGVSDTFAVLNASTINGTFDTLSGSFGAGLVPTAMYANGVVSLGILNALPVLDLASVMPSGTGLAFRISGVSGQTYTVESSTDLRMWNLVETRQLAGGTWDFADASASGERRFYRVGLVNP